MNSFVVVRFKSVFLSNRQLGTGSNLVQMIQNIDSDLELHYQNIFYVINLLNLNILLLSNIKLR